MPLTQFYHVRDPMENLLLSVTLRKISGFGSDSSADPVPVGRTWKYCFRWQEKKLSLSEKKRELERLEARGIQPSNAKRGDRNSPETDSTDVLSSYVDVDDFIPRELSKDPPCTSKNTTTHLIPPDLTRRPRDRRQEASWTSNQQRAWLRANREDKFRAMHIVALIEGAERALCSMRFYKESGLFCATPGFSAPVVDPESDPDLFIKGPKLTTYHISTSSGSLYEYVIDNTNGLLPFASAEDQRLSREIRLQEEKRDAAEVARWQQLVKNPTFLDALSSSSNNTRQMVISLEVISVDNTQTADPVVVEYELELPENTGQAEWRVLPGKPSRTRGKTPLSLPQPSLYADCASSAAFGWHHQFNLKLVKRELPSQPTDASSQAAKSGEFGDIVASPTLRVSVFSRDSWRRKHTVGQGEVKIQGSSGLYDVDVPIRKPILSIRDQMEELFLGIDESAAELDGGRCRINLDESPISTRITSRLGQKSESTGCTVRVRYNVVDLLPPAQAGGTHSTRLRPPLAVTATGNTRVVKRSVQEILQSVKLEKRLASITDPRIQAALRSLPANGVAAPESLTNESALI